jgi:hypothetical protein
MGSLKKNMGTNRASSVFDENSRIFKIKYIYFKILGLENTIYRVFSKIPNKIK